MSDYNDIINLPCPTSSKHPRMSAHARAAQFSPFAALTGHDEAIAETARLTDRKIELSEDEKEILDEKISFFKNVASPVQVTVTYFIKDEHKSGGAYISHTGSLCNIDALRKTLVFDNGMTLSTDDVYDIECDLFEDKI